MKKHISNILILISLIIIAFLICMKSPNNIFYQNQISLTDSSVFKYIGLSMTKGAIPYLDIFDHKGLLLYFINCLGTIISMNFGVWLLEFIFMFISLFFAYKLARKFTSKGVSLLIVCLAFSLIYNYFDGGNLTEEYALPFQLIALNVFFDFFLQPQKYSSTNLSKLNYKLFNFPVFICGICFSSVLFIRANMISVWIVFCLMVLIYCIVNKKYSEIIKFIISFALGMLVIFIPMFIYLLKNNAVKSFIDSYILFNMNYSENIKTAKCITLVYFFNTSVTSLAFIILGIKIYLQIKKRENYYFNLGYLGYMALTLLLIGMSGRIYSHYGMIIIPALIYPYCILYQFIETKELKKLGINLLVTGYILNFIIVPIGGNFLLDSLKSIQNRTTITDEETKKVIDYIKNNTNEDDTISVFGNSDYFYYLSNRKSASRYSYQVPIVATDKKIMIDYLADLKENKPKVIVKHIDDNFSEEIKLMNKYLKKNDYKLKLEIKNENIKVYKKES